MHRIPSEGRGFWMALAATGVALAALVAELGQPVIALAAVVAATASWTWLGTRHGHDRWVVILGRATWTLFAVAHTLLLIVGAGAPVPDIPLLLDVIGGSGFVAMGGWFLRMVWLRTRGGALGTWLDALLLGIALSAVGADVLLQPPAWLAAGPADLTAAASITVLVVLVTTLCVRLLLADAQHLPSAWLMVGVMAFAVLSHGSSALDTPVGTAPGQLANLGSYVLATAGFLHASHTQLLTPPPPDPRLRVSPLSRLGFTLAALLALPLLFVRHAEGGTEHLAPAFVASACALIVVWRLGLVLRDRQRASLELRDLADRETALATISRAGVEAREETTFLHRLAELTGEALSARATLCSPREPASQRSQADERSGRTTLCRPIDERVALCLTIDADRELDEPEQQFLDAVVDIAGAVLRRLDAEQQLHQIALHDPLTGLANRVLVWERLEHALHQGRGERATAGLALLAVDGLTRLDDLDDPAEADAPRHHHALVELARRLPHDLEPTDTLGRLRTDVLAVVLPRVDLADMETRTHALAAAVERALAEVDPTAEVRLTAISVLAHPRDTAQRVLDRAERTLGDALARGGGIVATVAGD